MATMCRQRAVSTPDPGRERYCLLCGGESEAYRCVETAGDLGAEEEETRLRAYWWHYMTHVETYTQWAERRKYFDPTTRHPDRRDGAIELVEDVLLLFYRTIRENRYDIKKGPPCKYLKRAMRNRFQDLLRRGRHHPKPDECARCREEQGMCSFSGTEYPSERERKLCLRPSLVEGLDGFDEMNDTFTAAGLHDQWPPTSRDVQGDFDSDRSREGEILDHVLIAQAQDLMPEVLTSDQQTVLVETYIHNKTSREIAERLQTTPGNVDQAPASRASAPARSVDREGLSAQKPGGASGALRLAILWT